jgi:hypothetical protein
MTQEPSLPTIHPAGEQLPVEVPAPSAPVKLDTFAGSVKVEWDETSPLTPLGQIAFFVEFLKVSGRLDAAIGDCPLVYLWALLERIPRDCWPTLLRGDSSIGSEGVMREAEGREVDYLFKLKLTKNVKRLIERTFMKGGWRDAGQGWQGKMETLRLMGWSRQRKVVVLRRRLKDGMAAHVREEPGQLRLSFAEIEDDTELYEYAVLVTSLDAEVRCRTACSIRSRSGRVRLRV